MKNERSKFARAVWTLASGAGMAGFTVWLAYCIKPFENKSREVQVVIICLLLIISAVIFSVAAGRFIFYIKAVRAALRKGNTDRLFILLSWVLFLFSILLAIGCYGIFILALWVTNN